MAKHMSERHRISLRKVTKLLRISRSSLYYKAKGKPGESQANGADRPEVHRGSRNRVRRMKEYLQKVVGKRISLKRVRRLMRNKGLKAVSPAPKTTESTVTHYIKT